MGERYHTRNVTSFYQSCSSLAFSQRSSGYLLFLHDESILHFVSLFYVGVGYDLLVNMLKYIAPTHVVKINISAQSKNLPDGTFWLDGNNEVMVNLIEISSAREDSFKRS